MALVFGRTRDGRKKRALAEDSELLAAVDRAIATNPSGEVRTVKEIAELTSPKEIAVPRSYVECYIKYRMLEKDRTDRKIAAPRRSAAAAG